MGFDEQTNHDFQLQKKKEKLTESLTLQKVAVRGNNAAATAVLLILASSWKEEKSYHQNF